MLSLEKIISLILVILVVVILFAFIPYITGAGGSIMGWGDGLIKNESDICGDGECGPTECESYNFKCKSVCPEDCLYCPGDCVSSCDSGFEEYSKETRCSSFGNKCCVPKPNGICEIKDLKTYSSTIDKGECKDLEESRGFKCEHDDGVSKITKVLNEDCNTDSDGVCDPLHECKDGIFACEGDCKDTYWGWLLDWYC